ncbi:hypothetical protein ES703_109929 [subsurface metagenome]
MSKSVTLKLSSALCDEEIEVPKELWKRFEKKARELGTPIEELFVIALDAFVKAGGRRKVDG